MLATGRQPIPLQGKWLQQIVSGYFNYHAVPTNSVARSTRSVTLSLNSGNARSGDVVREMG